MKTPKTIADLKYQDNVISVMFAANIQDKAQQFFQQAGIEGMPKVNYLFSEGGMRVWESYVDSGSVDYLYIIQ